MSAKTPTGYHYLDAVIESAESYAIALAEGLDPGVPIETARWLNDVAIRYLRGQRELDDTASWDRQAEWTRRERLLLTLVPADTIQPDMTFDDAWDAIRRHMDGETQRVAKAKSEVRRKTMMDLAGPADAMTEMQAELDELRAQVAARDEALRMIRNAATDEVGIV